MKNIANMNTSRRLLLGWSAGVALTSLCGPVVAATGSQGYEPLDWKDLMPPGWDPLAALKQANIDPRQIPEGSAEEAEFIRKMRSIWDSAPVRHELQGSRIRLPGYVVPLEYSRVGIREFLLVPYFGACIHSPPPPANQIVLVSLQKPAPLQSMDAISVWGTLGIQHKQTEWGISGYHLQARGTSAHKR